ncbi:MAG: hypothetical protein EBS86_13730, partial [Crocinitomicaceae bacterium]|nr:hypothetical protein [Crocinitomicaceae bacterium]
FAKMTEEELDQVSIIVNQKIRENIPVVIREMNKEEALKLGATALFGEKYGDKVRVVTIDPNYSVELCGGTHVSSTGELGYFMIVSESGIAAGVRRIESICGQAADIKNAEIQALLKKVQVALKNPHDIIKAIEQQLEETAVLKKLLEQTEFKLLAFLQKELLAKAEQIKGVNFISDIIDVSSPEMLKKLHITNFALIDETTIFLANGYTVITGETGSGKSILLNALNLILGERADFAVIGPKSNKAIVEAEFKDCSQFEGFFKENDLDFDGEILIRREISKEGKSRAFINDSPVQLTTLKGLAIQLVQIHSQYNTLELKSKTYQLEVLDILAGLEKERISFAGEFRNYQKKQREHRNLQEELEQALKSQDYNQFVLDELSLLNLSKIDYEQLERDLEKLEQSESLKLIFGELASVTEDNGLYENLLHIRSSLEKVAHLDQEIKEIASRTSSVLLELKELANDAVSYIETNVGNNESKYEITEKVDAYNRVLNKHRLSNQEQLIALEDEISQQTSSVDQLQEKVNQLQND